MSRSFKFFKSIFIMSLCVLLVFLFVGCKHSREVVRASKKLTSYDIEVNYCDENKKLSGSETVSYINSTNQDLEFLCFNLYPTAFSDDAKIKPYTKVNFDKCFPNGESFGDIEILSVRVNDENANFSIVGEDNNALRVELGFVLAKNKKVKVQIQFEVTLANCTHRLGYYDNTINVGNWYPIVAKFENGEFNLSPYYSTGDPFFSDMANYNVTINCQEDLIVSATGNLKEENLSDGRKICTFEALAVRDFAFCMSSNFQVKSEDVDGISVSVYAYKDDLKIDNYLKDGVNAVKLFNKLYGKYVYKKLDIVFTKFLHGGMEYPNMVMIADNLIDDINITKVIVHEIAHQWWYGIVGNNEVKDAWIDESMAEYSTVLFFEKYPEYNLTKDTIINEYKEDYRLYEDVMKSINMPFKSNMNLAVNEYSTEYEYVYMVYVKGTIFIDELRKKVGDEVFFKSLKKLYASNKFKIVTREDFFKPFEKYSKLNLESFVEEWLSGNTTI